MSINPIAYVKVLIVICVLISGDNFLSGLGKIYFIGWGIFSLLSGGLITYIIRAYKGMDGLK